jgi:dihydroflavonol-4-reductase
MKALVTGATGFIGANVTRELLKQDYQVRALVRKGSSLRNIEGLKIEILYGDLRDKESLSTALRGCDFLFHVAASYTFWTPQPEAVYETNVRGTENLLRSAMSSGIKKVVYTSTESTIGIDHNGCLGTEVEQSSVNTLCGHYKRSKLLAEQSALQMCQEGLPLVVVNPTTPVGGFDIKPTPTGELIVRFLNRRMPAYVNTGLNVVDVEDVAKGHVLALEKGHIGERYILGNRNLTLREILSILEQITGLKAPRLRVPIWMALMAAYGDEFFYGHILHKCPEIPVAAVKTSRKIRHFDCTKAIKELDLPQTPVESALEKAVWWFRQNGYVPKTELKGV